MNQEIKVKWISALKSGEYKQAKGALRTDDGYCCLGVLCDLYVKEFPDKAQWEKSHSLNLEYEFRVGDLQTSWGVLPKSIVEWADLREENPIVKPSTTLASLNDGGKTFEEIADVIEEKL